MNFAGVFRTPTVFFCQNNGYAISVPVSRQTAAASLAAKAEGYGFPGIRVDGNDVLAVHRVVREALRRARSAEGPTLIEAVTYRIGPHSTSDDPTVYRSEEEVAAWRTKDPIRRFAFHLRERGVLTDTLEAGAADAARRAVQGTVEAVEGAPPVPPESLFEDVYAEIPWHLMEQRATLPGGMR
jgi:TPP-dependent pyruvate/acetoin dehydrogenase alpha subunit